MHSTQSQRIPIPGALLFALFGSDVVASSGESDPCEFTGFNLASMGQIKKCSSDKVLNVHEIVVDGGKNCDDVVGHWKVGLLFVMAILQHALARKARGQLWIAYDSAGFRLNAERRRTHGRIAQRRRVSLLLASERKRPASWETAFIKMPSSGWGQTQFHGCYCYDDLRPMGMALPQKLTRKTYDFGSCRAGARAFRFEFDFYSPQGPGKIGKTRQRRSGPALRNAPYIFKFSTEVDFVFDNMLEVSAIGREHHLNPEGSLAFKVPLPNDTLDLLLRCYTNVLQEFAQ